MRIILFAGMAVVLMAAISFPGTKTVSNSQEKALAAVERAHKIIWKRFVDSHSIVIDFADSNGSFSRPIPEEFRDNKPNALAWWTPTENGSMFNGLYLDGLCQRWLQTKDKTDRKKARQLAQGLIFLASVGDTPGFIARGVATDGKTPPAMGSNDQSSPWFYGLWRYVISGLPDGTEKKQIIEKMTAVTNALVSTQWRIPTTSYSPSRYRNSFASFNWEGAPRILFILKAMHQLTGDAKWGDMYVEAAHAVDSVSGRSRLEICAEGMVFEKNKLNRWTGASGMVDLRALWEMETDPILKKIYLQGLVACAKSAATGIPLWHEFDNSDHKYFLQDWRQLNKWWKPQHSEQDALDVAQTQVEQLNILSPRRNQELHYMREPIWMSWIVTLCPDRTIVDSYRKEMIDMLGHFQYEQLYYSQFFPVEAIWFRLQTK